MNEWKEREISNIILYSQIWYEITCDIHAGSELLMAPKAPLQLRDIYNDSSPLDQYISDKDTGEHNFFQFANKFLFIQRHFGLFELRNY